VQGKAGEGYERLRSEELAKVILKNYRAGSGLGLDWIGDD
jgi:hypothetical protein